MKKNILFIGKNSLLASQLYDLMIKKFFIKKISFEDFLKFKSENLNNFSHVVNFSIKKEYAYNIYKLNNDLDILISKKLLNTKCIFVFLSSRKIYKAKSNIKEKSKKSCFDNYGKNKLTTENKLKKIFKNNLLILRISNLLTYNEKKNKNNRRLNQNFLNNFYKIRLQKKVYLTCNYFKDFITIEQLNKYLIALFQKKITGTYNISLGEKIYIREIISWIDNSFLKRIKFIKKPYNKNMSFYLNNSKVQKLLNLNITKSQVKRFCKKNLLI